jgi:reverse gyrase
MAEVEKPRYYKQMCAHCGGTEFEKGLIFIRCAGCLARVIPMYKFSIVKFLEVGGASEEEFLRW